MCKYSFVQLLCLWRMSEQHYIKPFFLVSQRYTVDSLSKYCVFFQPVQIVPFIWSAALSYLPMRLFSPVSNMKASSQGLSLKPGPKENVAFCMTCISGWNTVSFLGFFFGSLYVDCVKYTALLHTFKCICSCMILWWWLNTEHNKGSITRKASDIYVNPAYVF